jgi:hypothetical protein
MVVLVPIGSMLVEERRTEEDWTELVNKARNQVIEIMEARLKITGIKDMIVWEEVNTPVSCTCSNSDYLIIKLELKIWITGRDKFNLTHGSILGISHDFFNVLSFRKWRVSLSRIMIFNEDESDNNRSSSKTSIRQERLLRRRQCSPRNRCSNCVSWYDPSLRIIAKGG